MRTFIKQVIQEMGETWEALPKEVKVSAYIAVSYGISEIITLLSGLKVDNTMLAILINIVLVFLKELKPRIERIRNK